MFYGKFEENIKVFDTLGSFNIPEFKYIKKIKTYEFKR